MESTGLFTSKRWVTLDETLILFVLSDKRGQGEGACQEVSVKVLGDHIERTHMMPGKFEDLEKKAKIIILNMVNIILML